MNTLAMTLVAFLLSTAPLDDPNECGHSWSGPLYRFSERQVDGYLRDLALRLPDVPARVVQLARKNIGQPYELYLLGEAPFETTDPQPVYCLGKSDCVVFVEHTLAMALTDSFPKFMSMLQRIRYRDGAIGVLTRNHYTEADWNVNNRWLVREITEEIGGETRATYTLKIDRATFFKNRYKLDAAIPVQSVEQKYIPYSKIDAAKSGLRSGDVVNFVYGKGNGRWVGHLGLVVREADGEIRLIHSSEPVVREESIDQYIARAVAQRADKIAAGKHVVEGFMFLRLTDDPWAELRKIDGDAAPKVTVPAGSPVTWEQFLKNISAN